ncbi:HlyD family secretion protein [Cohaesibacter sp. ES.047]|uniref:HlyD family secretion protein n=1 Tax=Cohaesibacter sp. ES.047 TaxID=1798205 RepID=UPI000BB853DB|nr:HlyD family secretion protein [Cohaesibacter sp. ES.047]SNY92259.1 HlyD family secretion protein [Cohaesibacter sp. ES.047]
MLKSKILPLVIFLFLLVGGYVIWSVLYPEELLVQGEVEATRVDVAAQVTARVAETPVGFGDKVKAGQVLIKLASPQLRASLVSAKAALDVAKANRDLAFSTRPETIDAARAALGQAKASEELAQKTFDRLEKLRNSNTVSAQSYDQAYKSLTAAKQAALAAEAQLKLAIEGSSAETKAVAEAKVEQAQAAVAQIETNIDELTLYAPIDGQITARMAEKGKLFSAGAPQISLIDSDHPWFTFNLREDLLNGLAVGDVLKVRIPALGDRELDIRITAINVEGSYANWRATKATGDFDLRTFSIRAEPEKPDEDLRPGMSALISWSVPEKMDR